MDPQLYSARRRKCTSLMQSAGLRGILLARPANLFYLTGDRRLCAFAFVSRDGEVCLGVPLTDLEDARQTSFYDCVVGYEDRQTLIDAIGYFLGLFGIDRGSVGLEYDYVTQPILDLLADPGAKQPGVTLVDASGLLAGLRQVKDMEEIAAMRLAADVAVTGMQAALGSLRPGISETELAGVAELAMRRAGAEALGTTYVLTGPRTQVAHGLPTCRTLEAGDLAIVDLHPAVDGYRSELCRTVCCGEPSADQRTVYDLYLKAQQATIAAARPGTPPAALEQTMTRLLSSAGQGWQSYGAMVHGIGIELEEAPAPPEHAILGRPESPLLEPNVVLSVGNRTLCTGEWGVRVEDTIVVGADGPEFLTDFPRQLAF